MITHQPPALSRTPTRHLRRATAPVVILAAFFAVAAFALGQQRALAKEPDAHRSVDLEHELSELLHRLQPRSSGRSIVPLRERDRHGQLSNAVLRILSGHLGSGEALDRQQVTTVRVGRSIVQVGPVWANQHGSGRRITRIAASGERKQNASVRVLAPHRHRYTM